MTDRELLELAAKAAGIGYDPTKEGDDIGRTYSEHLGLWIWHWKDWFSPLTDDGDALRLAVKLKMAIDICNQDDVIFAVSFDDTSDEAILEKIGDDPCASTRRAIVRAAAAIAEKEAK